MRSTFNILFYLNTSKRKKSGLCPVMGRITVDGGIAQFSLKKDAHPHWWDSGKGRAKGKTREQMELNKTIAQTEVSIKNIYSRMIETSGYVTAEQIKNELTGAVRKTANLLQLFREHNTEYQKRVGIDRRSRTYMMYEGSYRHLSRFVNSKYRMDDYPLQQLNISFINDYDYYLQVDARLAVISVINHIIVLKKLITMAIRQEIILRDPFTEYTIAKPQHKYRHLSGEELERLVCTKVEPAKVCFVRDMFLFSCFTGLAYADMCNLSEKHLQKMPDGNVWIDIPRQKTGVESKIRLLDIPKKMIEKYRWERKSDKLFNMPNISYISYYMPKLAKLCNMKQLQFHMARHTFATEVCLTNGVPMETLSKMMGHSSIRSTQIYAEITGKKISEDMKKLSGRTKGKYTIS